MDTATYRHTQGRVGSLAPILIIHTHRGDNYYSININILLLLCVQHGIVVWLKYYYSPNVIVFVAVASQNLYTVDNFLSLFMCVCVCFSLHNICSWVREHSLGLGAFPWYSLSLFPSYALFLSLIHPKHYSSPLPTRRRKYQSNRQVDQPLSYALLRKFLLKHQFTFTFREFKKYRSLSVFIIFGGIYNYRNYIYIYLYIPYS